MERFTEDALRILRAIRFSAQLDFEIEKETFEAISVIAPNLAKVSKERIQMELTKLLCSEHPEKIREVYETGISTYVSPAFAALDWQNAGICGAAERKICTLGSLSPLRKQSGKRSAGTSGFKAG